MYGSQLNFPYSNDVPGFVYDNTIIVNIVKIVSRGFIYELFWLTALHTITLQKTKPHWL